MKNYFKDNIQIYNTDCVEFMKTFPDKYFNLSIVDPPYGLESKSSTGSGKLKERAFNVGNIKEWDNAPTEEYFQKAVERIENCSRIDSAINDKFFE